MTQLSDIPAVVHRGPCEQCCRFRPVRMRALSVEGATRRRDGSRDIGSRIDPHEFCAEDSASFDRGRPKVRPLVKAYSCGVGELAGRLYSSSGLQDFWGLDSAGDGLQSGGSYRSRPFCRQTLPSRRLLQSPLSE